MVSTAGFRAGEMGGAEGDTETRTRRIEIREMMSLCVCGRTGEGGREGED